MTKMKRLDRLKECEYIACICNKGEYYVCIWRNEKGLYGIQYCQMDPVIENDLPLSEIKRFLKKLNKPYKLKDFEEFGFGDRLELD